MAPAADDFAGPAPAQAPAGSLRRQTATKRSSRATSISSEYSVRRTSNADSVNEWGMDSRSSLNHISEEPLPSAPALAEVDAHSLRSTNVDRDAAQPSTGRPNPPVKWPSISILKNPSPAPTKSRPDPLTIIPGPGDVIKPPLDTFGSTVSSAPSVGTSTSATRPHPKSRPSVTFQSTFGQPDFSQPDFSQPRELSPTSSAVNLPSLADVKPAPSRSATMLSMSSTGALQDSPMSMSPVMTPSAPPLPGTSKSKPRLSLSTATLASLPSVDDEKQQYASPGMAHWRQVRQHVMLAPVSAEEEREPPQKHGKRNIMTRAAGRFGFRHAVENVLGYDRRRGSTYGTFPGVGASMTEEEREEASRQRRRFARDVKVCLEACAAEESRRRLWRLAGSSGQQPRPPPTPSHKTKSVHHSAHGYDSRTGGASTHSSAYHLPPGAASSNEFSAFAPLLTELHKYIRDARAKRVWSRTCPHHAAILAELGTTFLPDSASTDGERAQVLELFGTVVRNWSTDSEDEELDRWLWLCRAMLIDDRPLRNRGLSLLSQLLRMDESLPENPGRPSTASDFESLAVALITLLHALDRSPYQSPQHQDTVSGLLTDLGAGTLMKVDHASLIDILSDLDIDSTGRMEHELLWLAVARAIMTDHHLGLWLMDRNAAILKRFAPGPVLPGMPTISRRLRVFAATQLFAAFSMLVRKTDDEEILASIAAMAEACFEETTALPEHGEAIAAYAILLLDLDRATGGAVDNPFHSSPHRLNLQLHLKSRPDILATVAESVVSSYTPATAMAITRQFLCGDMAALGQACVSPLLDHITTLAADEAITDFLKWLVDTHPHLFYKPLFTCSGAGLPTKLSAPLGTVHALANLLGPEAFWTRADPQMVAIVLVGDIAKPSRTKSNPEGKDDGNGYVNVKLGRYAMLVELIDALKDVKKTSSNLQTFATALETRLGAMLEVVERSAPLPEQYRALICQLLDVLRVSANLIKRTAATRVAAYWFTAPGRSPRSTTTATREKLQSLGTLYKQILGETQSARRLAILKVPITMALPKLLVTIQASLGAEEWGGLLPVVWERYGQVGQPVEQLTFLMMKCAEAASGGLRNLVSAELFNAGPVVRHRTLLKLCMLYGYRYQVYTQETVTDRRGLQFRFQKRSLDFVMAELGSATWVTPHEAHAAALQKYGRSLPLEMRQGLMELGWTEDTEMLATDIERVPVSMLPSTGRGAAVSELKITEGNAAPPKLKRQGSDASNRSASLKLHRAVVPTDLVAIVIDQARILATSDDVHVELLSRELVRMFERDDAVLLSRPVSENLSVDIGNALGRLNALIAQPTPGFAYVALNALVGFLKMAVRKDAAYPGWAGILGTIARLVPRVCELSLRDVRKTKSENILLPASIYESEQGFKLHQPWREGYIDVQTAQLILLSSMVRTNPRDVYLVKKMLFSLQVQESMRNLEFARAWVQLMVDLFGALNSNYNDRAELRHFLSNIGTALTRHGATDLIVAAHCMRALSLCATRFRRVFASIGFVEVMKTVYAVYVDGHDGIKDAVEYACRSFYRVHQDVFVLQLCLALADNPYNPRAAYDLVVSLSKADIPQAGVPSGIRGLNDKHEIAVLVQMMSGGAEVALSELGSRAEQRKEQRAATLSLESVVFPRENIVRLLVTVIAVNPASKRSIKLLKLFAALVPYSRASTEPHSSRELVVEAIDVIGQFIHRTRTSDDVALRRLLPGDDGGEADWQGARRAYLDLVDAFASVGGAISVTATGRLLDIVMRLLRDDNAATPGPTTASILGALARTHLEGNNATTFLANLVPAYRQHIATVDFSGVLEAIAALIKRNNYQLGGNLPTLIVYEYVAPAIRMLAFASEESMGFIVPLRKAAVDLLAAAVFLPGADALSVLEHVVPSPGLLAGVILPLCLLLERPHDVDRDETYAALWVRLLRLSLRPCRGKPLVQAAQAALAVQIVKVVAVRVPDSISAQRGLWTYLATYVLSAVEDGNGRFYAIEGTPLAGTDGVRPRIVDWMMWSLFEMLALYRSPLALDLRLRIQQALATVSEDREASQSRPSSAGSSRSAGVNPFGGNLHGFSPARRLTGLVRRPSARIVSPSGLGVNAGPHSPGASPAVSPLAPVPEGGLAPPTPGSPGLAPEGLSPKTVPNTLATPGSPTPGHSRSVSGASATSAYSALSAPGSPLSARFVSGASSGRRLSASPGGVGGGIRPSFSALSARRASRPTFDAFPSGPRAFRFPTASSTPARPGDRGAIIHLLGPAAMAATAGGPATAKLTLAAAGDPVREALREPLRSPALRDAARRALTVTMVVFGYDVDEDVAVHAWSVADALVSPFFGVECRLRQHAVTEQTRALVEDELADLFHPASDSVRFSRADFVEAATTSPTQGHSPSDEKHSVAGSKRSSFAAYSDGHSLSPDDEHAAQLPTLSYTLNHGFDEGYTLVPDTGHAPNGGGPASPSPLRTPAGIPTVAVSQAL